jgi:hypothetical protein
MDRDANGRYLKGHKSNGGRPSRPREEQYYHILMTTVTYDDWRAIINKAIEQAKRGDYQARKWLSDYLAGEPEHTISGNFVIRWEDNGAED